MSYCRFSSDNYQSDIYCYEHMDGGWMVNVAAKRHTSTTPIPILPIGWWNLEPQDAMKHLQAQRAWLDQAELTSIGLPHDGEEFVEESAGACLLRLDYLRGLGYLVPQGAIDALKDESMEEP